MNKIGQLLFDIIFVYIIMLLKWLFCAFYWAFLYFRFHLLNLIRLFLPSLLLHFYCVSLPKPLVLLVNFKRLLCSSSGIAEGLIRFCRQFDSTLLDSRNQTKNVEEFIMFRPRSSKKKYNSGVFERVNHARILGRHCRIVDLNPHNQGETISSLIKCK